MAVTQDQDTRPALPFPTPTVDATSSDALPEDTAVASNSPLYHNPTPFPSTPPFETSLAFEQIDGFLKDICEFLYTSAPSVVFDCDSFCFSPTGGTPVYRFSHPTPTFEAHGTRDFPPSSSLDGLKIVEDLPWLMDQGAPPSPIESPSGSSIPPFEKVISRVRARKAEAVAQKDQAVMPTRDPEIFSTGKLETSMSLGRIAYFLCNICACFGLLTLVHL